VIKIERVKGERAYRVRAVLPMRGFNVTRTFLWGQLDEGDVSWQRALADAKFYARDLQKANRTWGANHSGSPNS
jgi:hypothetical protein